MKSLLARFLLVVAAAALPSVALQLYSEGEARQVRQQLLEDEARRLVRNLASEQQRILEGADQLLSGIAATPAVQEGRLDLCQRLFANLLQEQPRYIGGAFIGLDGHTICGPGPIAPDIAASDRTFFRLALQTGGFVVGDYVVGDVTGQRSVHLAKPVRNRDGAVIGVATLALGLDWLGRQLEAVAMPAGTGRAIMDRNGTTLARFPDPQHTVGLPMPAANRFTLEGSGIGIAPITDRDGTRRILGYSPPGADPKGLLVAVGLDQAVSYAAVARANRTGLALILGGAALALLITALLGTQLIRRPVRRLLAAAERWRAGDLTARSGVPADSSEFGRLGAAFDTMATALAARERALSMALESTTDNVVVLDRAWRVSFLNGRAKAAFAQDRELTNQMIWDALPELADTSIGTAFRTAMEQGVPTQASAYSPTFGKDFEAHAYPSDDGLTVFFRDVTQERRMAAALVESERHFRATFEQAAVGMAQVGLDDSWLLVNDKLCTIIGCARNELIGRQLWEVTYPDDVASQRALQHALLAGEVSTISMEKRYLRRDGGIIWINLTATLLHDAMGKPDRYLSVIEDISDRKRVEVALQESEALLRAVLEQIPAAVTILKRPDGRVALRSRFSETSLGPPPDRPPQDRPASLGRAGEHPDGRPYALEEYPAWRALYRGETVMAEPLLFRRPDGGLMELEIYAAPIRDAAGAIIAAVVAAFDMTERSQARRVLAQSNAELEARVRAEVAAREAAQTRAAQAERIQALGQLAGGIAHDFNNILQAVEGAAALIERRPHDEAGVRRMARLLSEAVSRGASITRRLLTFGRRADLRAEPLEVAAMLGGMQEIFAHTLGAGIEVEVRLADDVPPVLADRGQLETALVNLATNARDAMPGGGRLTLAATAEIMPADGSPHPLGLAPGRYVRISLADAGTGMDATTLARATEPFFTTKPSGAGTGLGLPMVRGFVEQSGGKLDIASSPGTGTTVSLYLPAAEGAGVVAATEPKDAGEAPAPGPAATVVARILLVDDEDLLREVLAEQLEDAGYEVQMVANGADALALLAADERVDLLITDLSMPGMDGLAVIRAARDVRPGLPTVLLTGYAGESAAIAADAATTGSFSLLRKPIRLRELTDRLQSLLAARRNTRQQNT